MEELAKAPKNAFIESLPPPQEVVSYVAEDGLPTVNPTGNLTEDLAQNLAREMVAQNPEGPGTSDSGFSLVVPEDLQSVASQIALASPALEIETEKDALIPLSEKDASVVSNYSAEDIAAYTKAVNIIINDGLTPAQVEAMIRDLPQAEAMNTLGLTLESAILQLKKVSVPKPLADFHRSFIQVLAYQKRGLDLANNPDDPLRASMVLEAVAKNYDEAVSRFYAELEKVNSTDLSIGAQTGKLAMLLGVISPVKTANALSIIGVQISFDPAVFGRMIWNFTRSVLLETLKDRLIHQLVTQVIRWVQGGGTPQFVTNWRAFLNDATNKAVGDVIYKVAPQMCSSFGPLIRIALTPVQPLESPVACTLDQVVANVRNFYNNFNNGGWIAYTTSLQPQNNFLGALIQTSDIVALESAKAREEAEKKAVTGGGFTPTELCAKWDYRNKWQQCVLENGSENKCKGIPNVTEKVCTQYQATTPGSAVQQITVAALNSPISRIVNAQDIAALTSAFVNAALNKLVQLGQKGISSLFGGSSSASAGGQPAPSATEYQTLCQALDESIAAVKRFRDFAETNQNQLKSDGENFRIKADSVVWYNRAIDANSPVAGLQSNVSGFRDAAWDPVEIQIGRFTNWLEEVITSLVKDEDLDFDGEWSRDNPPTQGTRGVIRMTNNFGSYLEDLKQVVGDNCTNTSGLGNIPDPDIGVPNEGGGVSSGTQAQCTDLGRKEQDFMLPLLNEQNVPPQEVATRTNQQFNLTYGNEAVYYPYDPPRSYNTIGLPEFYLAGPTPSRPTSPATGLPWDVVIRCQ